MKAYYFDNLPGDEKLPHIDASSTAVTADILKSINVQHWSIPVDNADLLDDVARERGYASRDIVDVTKEGLGDAYEAKMAMFYKEHMHDDEEIRYCLSGSGFFDIREMPSDSWIRVQVFPGDLLVVPAGIYHRFTLDEGCRIKMVRLFKDQPKWEAHNRNSLTDVHPQRVEYLRSIA